MALKRRRQPGGDSGPTPKRAKTLVDEDFLPGKMNKPTFIHFVKLMAENHQHGVLAKVARLNKFCQAIVTPKLFEHVRLTSAKSVASFFNHFQYSPPSLLSESAQRDLADECLISRVDQAPLRKLYLPGLIKHLDIEFDIKDLDAEKLVVFRNHPWDQVRGKVSEKPLLHSLETLHIQTWGMIRKGDIQDVHAENREAQNPNQTAGVNTIIARAEPKPQVFKQSNTVRLLSHLVKFSAPIHLRWVPFEDREVTDLFEEVEGGLKYWYDYSVFAALWLHILPTDQQIHKIESFDLPILTFLAVKKVRRVLHIQDDGDMVAVRQLVHQINDNASRFSKGAKEPGYEGSHQGLSAIIDIRAQEQRAEVMQLLRDLPPELKPRCSISLTPPFQLDSADAWRKWLEKDERGEEVTW